MEERLYDIMSDLNEIMKDIDSMIAVSELESHGIIEGNYTNVAPSLLSVHIRLLKGIQADTYKLFTKIDETVLDVKYERI